MKRNNLLAIADLMTRISQDKFDMEDFREDLDDLEPSCNTIGCAIGHSTCLDPNNLEIFIKKESSGIQFIHFANWSEFFTGLSWTEKEWHWCFDSIWMHYDNTPLGVRYRIFYLLDGNRIPHIITKESVKLYEHYKQLESIENYEKI